MCAERSHTRNGSQKGSFRSSQESEQGRTLPGLADNTKNSNSPLGMGGIMPLLPRDPRVLAPRTCARVALYGSGAWQM